MLAVEQESVGIRAKPFIRFLSVFSPRRRNGLNIKANDYRLITVVQYVNGVMMIRFFGSHEEYDRIDAETV